VDEAAAGVDDVRDVAFSLVLGRPDQRFAQPADHPGRVVAVEKERADAVLPHRPHAVTEHEPPGFGFDR